MKTVQAVISLPESLYLSHNVPVIDYDDDETDREFATAENISELLIS
jgi:hypothetical protein